MVTVRLTAMAAEISDHHCFDAVFDLSLIISLPIATDLEYQELSGIVDYAEQHGKTGEWRSLLHRRLRKWRLRSMSARLLKTFHSVVRKQLHFTK